MTKLPKSTKTVHPEVTAALDTIATYLTTCRMDLALRQVDVAEAMGTTLATVQRIENIPSTASLTTFLGYLRELGGLDDFLEMFPSDESDDRRRVRFSQGPKSIDADLDHPLSAGKFLKYHEQHPTREVWITNSAGIKLSRAGFAIRSQVSQITDEVLLYATTVEQALTSEHEYQAPDGSMIGRQAKMNLVLAQDHLSDQQLNTIIENEEAVRDAINLRLKADGSKVFITEVALSRQVLGHVLRRPFDDQIINSPATYDTINAFFAEGAA